MVRVDGGCRHRGSGACTPSLPRAPRGVIDVLRRGLDVEAGGYAGRDRSLGAGRDTLLLSRCVGGLEPLQEGRATSVTSRPRGLAGGRPSPATGGRRSGSSSMHFGLLEDPDRRENVGAGGDAGRVAPGRSPARAPTCVDAVGLGHRARATRRPTVGRASASGWHRPGACQRAPPLLARAHRQTRRGVGATVIELLERLRVEHGAPARRDHTGPWAPRARRLALASTFPLTRGTGGVGEGA
jgi:hypothetical protein